MGRGHLGSESKRQVFEPKGFSLSLASPQRLKGEGKGFGLCAGLSVCRNLWLISCKIKEELNMISSTFFIIPALMPLNSPSQAGKHEEGKGSMKRFWTSLSAYGKSPLADQLFFIAVRTVYMLFKANIVAFS